MLYASCGSHDDRLERQPIFLKQSTFMKYEFKVNGTIKLIIKPESNLEIELFKELFSGEVKVVPTTSTNPSGEVVVEKTTSQKPDKG
jgi:hypothetical protein